MEQKPILSDLDTPYIAKEVVAQLTKAKRKVVEGDQDRVYVVSGREGLGKSTLALQLAYFLDPTFSINDIVFSAKTFARRIREAPKFKSIVFDEAFNGLSSKGSISKENKELVRLLQECRQRNLFIFIVLPSFFLLEKYVGIFRSTALFNVLASRKNFKLRYYRVYNYTNKKKLFLLGKPLMDYSRPYIPQKYRFYKRMPPTINRDEYLQKKLEAFRESGLEPEVETKQMRQRNACFRYLHDNFNMKYTEISNMLESYGCRLDPTQIGRYIRNAPLKNEK